MFPWLLAFGLSALPVRCETSAPADAGIADQKEGEIHLTREQIEAIRLGQEFLARIQQPDGSIKGAKGDSSAIVGLSVLAWMVNGNFPGEGPFGKNVSLGVSYLVKLGQPSGLIYKGNVGGKEAMYHHGIAAIALAEAWGHSQDGKVQEVLKRAIDLIVRCQSKEGGWRYNPDPQGGADLSVTVMQLLALRAAREAGIAVPKKTIENAVRYVESCRQPKGADGFGGFGYQKPGRGPGTTAMGVMSLMLCGNYDPSRLKEPVVFLDSLRLKKDKDGKDMDPLAAMEGYPYYRHYYAAQAMYQVGSQGPEFKKYWLEWYPWIAKKLLTEQDKAGSGRGTFRINPGEQGETPTSFCLLILGVPYRYLPIYQR
jgi:hypothetical protein